jgi:hypothetical protein
MNKFEFQHFISSTNRWAIREVESMCGDLFEMHGF